MTIKNFYMVLRLCHGHTPVGVIIHPHVVATVNKAKPL